MMVLGFVRRLFSAEGIGLMLVLLALQAFAVGISSSLRQTDTPSFFWVCLLAAVIAFGLSRRNTNGLHAGMGLIVLGIIGVWILGARLAVPLLDLGSAIVDVISQLVPAIRSNLPLDTTDISEAWSVITGASNVLSLRVVTWFLNLSGDSPVNDALVRTMVWLLILWLTAAWMGWFAARRNAIAALLPSIMLLAAIISYSERRIEVLWVMVFVLLLLMGIWNYRNHTAQWERRKVDYADSIRFDVAQAVVLLSLLIGVLAFVTPSLSWQAIRDFFRARGQNQIAERLGVEQQQVPAREASAPQPTLPRDHLLSGGNALSEKIVMTIRTGERVPLMSNGLAADAPRYYWRSITYDIYTGSGWLSSAASSQAHSADIPLIPGLLNGYRALVLDVQMARPEGKLFWTGILFSADVPLTAYWRLRPQSNLFADQSSLLQADMFAALSQAEVYRAQSYIPIFTVEELQAASTEYPDEIRDSYLLLPRSLPGRVIELAHEITRDKTTAYDKAKAIEDYLRSYPYDLEIPPPPPDQDVADYFLFELKKGYCDYYATAMVVLARASGLPARFVSGYAPGSYEVDRAGYVVRELDAHSWAEIYFPEIGWIEFEPTAAQPEIERPPRKDVPVNTPADRTAARLLNHFRLQTLVSWFSPLAIVLLSLVIYFSLIERWLYLRLAPARVVEKIYRRLYRLGRPLAGERTKAETASEFREKLSKRIEEIRSPSRLAAYFFRAQQEITVLTDLYQDTLFTHQMIDKNRADAALRTWKHLRLRLMIARLIVSLYGVILNSTRFVRNSS